jgi:hypothetical protein
MSDFSYLKQRLDEICQILSEMNKKRFTEQFLDNDEFVSFLGISKKTAQAWREEGVIRYAQLGKKIYYRLSDIEAMFDKEFNRPKAVRKKGTSRSPKLKISPESNGWTIRAGKIRNPDL